MRIAKYIAHSGYCSRREAENYIINKKVKVNNLLCTNLSTKISKQDILYINGLKLTILKKNRIWKFYKPKGIICTSKDPKKRKSIFDILPKSLPRIISIGRLDINSEGLLLLTNNGDLARFFELPKNKIQREYLVKVRGLVHNNKLELLKDGIKINGISYKGIKCKLIKNLSSNSWIKMQLIEGKNREIRKICSYFGWEVSKLIRQRYGKFNLGNLKPGVLKEVKDHPYSDVYL